MGDGPFGSGNVDISSWGLNDYISHIEEKGSSLLMDSFNDAAIKNLSPDDYMVFSAYLAEKARDETLSEDVRNSLAKSVYTGWVVQSDKGGPMKELSQSPVTPPANKNDNWYTQIDPNFTLEKVGGKLNIATTKLGPITKEEIEDNILYLKYISNMQDDEFELTEASFQNIIRHVAWQRIAKEEMFNRELFDTKDWKSYWDYEETNFLYDMGLELLKKDLEVKDDRTLLDMISQMYSVDVSDNKIGDCAPDAVLIKVGNHQFSCERILGWISMEPDNQDVIEGNILSQAFVERLLTICKVLSYLDEKGKDTINEKVEILNQFKNAKIGEWFIDRIKFEKYYNDNINNYLYYTYESGFIRIDNPLPGEPWSDENTKFINEYAKEWKSSTNVDNGIFLAVMKGQAPDDIKGLIGYDSETLYEENISLEEKQELDKLNPGDITGPVFNPNNAIIKKFIKKSTYTNKSFDTVIDEIRKTGINIDISPEQVVSDYFTRYDFKILYDGKKMAWAKRHYQ